MLRATTACTFSTSQLPKVVRCWGVLYILTSKRASRHKGVQFFISHLASWLRTRRFSEPTFRPSGAPNHWKNTVFRDFPSFSRICIFFLLIFSLLTLLTSAFQLSILSEVSLLNFLRSFNFTSLHFTSFHFIPLFVPFHFDAFHFISRRHSVCPSIHAFTNPRLHASMHPSIHPSIHSFIHTQSNPREAIHRSMRALIKNCSRSSCSFTLPA